MHDKRSVSYSHQNHLDLFNRTASFSSSVSGEYRGWVSWDHSLSLFKGGEILFRLWAAMNPFLHADIFDPLWLNCWGPGVSEGHAAPSSGSKGTHADHRGSPPCPLATIPEICTPG